MDNVFFVLVHCKKKTWDPSMVNLVKAQSFIKCSNCSTQCQVKNDFV